MAPTRQRRASEPGAAQRQGDRRQHAAPLLRVVNPDATPEEVAALVAVFAALGSAGGEPPRRRTPEWSAPHRGVRRTHLTAPAAGAPAGWPASTGTRQIQPIRRAIGGRLVAVGGAAAWWPRWTGSCGPSRARGAARRAISSTGRAVGGELEDVGLARGERASRRRRSPRRPARGRRAGRRRARCAPRRRAWRPRSSWAGSRAPRLASARLRWPGRPWLVTISAARSRGRPAASSLGDGDAVVVGQLQVEHRHVAG